MVFKMNVETFLNSNNVLEVKISIRNFKLDPEDTMLFAQTNYFRIVKYRLNITDSYINYFITDFHSSTIPDGLVNIFNDIIDYFKNIDYPHKLVLNLVNLEKEKAIAGTFISDNNEVFSFKLFYNSDEPELVILSAYYTTQQVKLILEDFINEFGDYIHNLRDKEALLNIVKFEPSGEVAPAIQIKLPTQQVKKDKENKHLDYTYL